MPEITSPLIIEPKPPNYRFSDRRSPVGKQNDLAFERHRLELQMELDKLPLSEALKILRNQQMDIGFIQDDLTEVRYFQAYGPKERFFIGQFNPRRADRSGGAGRKHPPAGVETVEAPSLGCFLCVDHVRWRSCGIQLYYQIKIGDHTYNCLCNPFPFMPTHITVCSAEHEPQSWHESVNWKEDKVTRLVQDLYDAAMLLPDFVGFYNGVGAGASIEGHFHFHFFQIPMGHGLFPLQHVAHQVQVHTKANAMITEEFPTLMIDLENYPLTAFRFVGTRDVMTKAIIDRIKRWNALAGSSASANLIAIWEKNGDHDELAIYMVPRNKFFYKAPGMVGTVGGLEVLGEFIFSTKEEDANINTQKVDYQYMATILRSVRPPNVERLNIK